MTLDRARRRLHRRFGTRRLFASVSPGRYVPLTPLGMVLTRDGGRIPAIERRKADSSVSRRAGWWVIGPPSWEPSVAFDTARDAAQRLHAVLREHDRDSGGLADP